MPITDAERQRRRDLVRDVELPFVTFYRFDSNGKLASERVVMDLGALQSAKRKPLHA